MEDRGSRSELSPRDPICSERFGQLVDSSRPSSASAAQGLSAWTAENRIAGDADSDNWTTRAHMQGFSTSACSAGQRIGGPPKDWQAQQSSDQ